MKGRLWSGVVSAMRRAKAKEVPGNDERGELSGHGEEEFLGKVVKIPGGDGQNLVTSHFGIVLDLASSLMGMKQQR